MCVCVSVQSFRRYAGAISIDGKRRSKDADTVKVSWVKWKLCRDVQVRRKGCRREKVLEKIMFLQIRNEIIKPNVLAEIVSADK